MTDQEFEKWYESVHNTNLKSAAHTGLVTGPAEIDQVYWERNRLVRFLASLYPSGIKRTEISDWEPEWHNCVFIDTPEGQLSWHYHDRETATFADLPPYSGQWDGHTTEEKYARLARLY